MPNDLRREMQAILADLPDPRGGLPDAVFAFVSKIVPLVNVDLLIRNDDSRTLVTWREDEFGAGWHIPGGIIRFFEEAARRIAAVADQELGATVEAELYPRDIMQTFTERGHFISLIYRCKLTSPLRNTSLLYQGGRPGRGMLAWIAGVPDQLYPLQVSHRHLFQTPG
jgi:colanic acid biosynthesis protein WcaH